MPVTNARLTEQAAELLPEIDRSVVAIPAPGEGPGFWAGASSAVEVDGEIYMAYRVRQPIALGRGQGVVVARSKDGEHFETLTTISKESMDAESLERPTLLRTPEGRWRLYLSCATAGTKHWRVELLEADEPGKFDPKTRRVVLPGDDKWAVKDTVIVRRDGLWHLWASCHPLDVPGQEDRMVSKYATSDDGVAWVWHGTALDVRPGMWDSRGARITAVQEAGGQFVAYYDGRASAKENYDERTGVALGTSLSAFTATGDVPFGQSPEGKALRYLDIMPLADAHKRLYYELARPDGSHELRTELR
jgi:hypothetical protein